MTYKVDKIAPIFSSNTSVYGMYFVPSCPEPAGEVELESDRLLKKFRVRRLSAEEVASTHKRLSDEMGDKDPNSQALLQLTAALRSRNDPQLSRIAERLSRLRRDAIEEDECIDLESIRQFGEFFLNHRGLAVPKITLTPDGTLSARWIHGPGDFIAIEFTGKSLAKVVAEIPREGDTASHFFSEPLEKLTSIARAIGASLAHSQ